MKASRYLPFHLIQMDINKHFSVAQEELQCQNNSQNQDQLPQPSAHTQAYKTHQQHILKQESNLLGRESDITFLKDVVSAKA